jgi:alkylation response protein AidB-like acyl-CoA dehydrogenase
MDLARSDEQQAIVESARDFGRERIAPHAAGWEGRRHHAPGDAMVVPEDLGGASRSHFNRAKSRD